MKVRRKHSLSSCNQKTPIPYQGEGEIIEIRVEKIQWKGVFYMILTLVDYSTSPYKQRASMCGRFTLFASPEKLAAYFRFDSSEDSAPRYNICPSQTIPCIIQDETGKLVIKFCSFPLV
jgi:hypothetical protein